MPDDLIPTIQTNAAAPRSAMVKGGSASQHSLPDQIEADAYLKSASALKKRPLGIRYVKLIPPNPGDVDLCR